MILDTNRVVSLKELKEKYICIELQKSRTSTTNQCVANKTDSMVPKKIDRIWDQNSIIKQLTYRPLLIPPTSSNYLKSSSYTTQKSPVVGQLGPK
jgi:hypothetical protein